MGALRLLEESFNVLNQLVCFLFIYYKHLKHYNLK
jgi:hypothetical protein